MTGFSDGEASFTFSRSSRQIALYFAIKLTATDRAMLEAIQVFFGGIGSIYTVAARAPRAENSGATKTAAMYRVTRVADLVRVVSHFDAYPLQSEKRVVYQVWRAMVELKRDFRGATREALEDLAIELSSRVPRNQSWR